MKIHTLFLHAFGPFTQTVLDFSGSAQLHLVYGPNEAGKSSALRAMGDLRYGIHAQSKDDFLHAYREMSLAGTFVDASGQLLGLARRIAESVHARFGVGIEPEPKIIGARW